MDLIALSRLGGRHLVTLHLLLDNQSVTRTAERLCTTPSTVSKTLNQLRDLLGDQLLYRQGNQLLLTPMAERLAPTLHRLLGELNGLTRQNAFNPQQWQGSLRLGLRESVMTWPVGPILGRLMKEVPGMVPEIWNKDEQGLEALAAGKLDFVILPHDQSQPLPRQPGLVWETLREEKLVCLLRKDHPALAKPWDLDAYLGWRHIAIRDQELANPFFEQSLAQQQVRRQIGATLPDFASAAALLPQTDSDPHRHRWLGGLHGRSAGSGDASGTIRLRQGESQSGLAWPGRRRFGPSLVPSADPATGSRIDRALSRATARRG